MSNSGSVTNKQNKSFPCVTFVDGKGGLPMVRIISPWSNAEIFLHGAQVTHFQIKDEPPLLFLSQQSRFAAGQPIRGGIPIVFPWFGKPAGKPGQHGFARVRDWELKEISVCPEGGVSVLLQMPEYADSSECPACKIGYLVSVGKMLSAELRVTNQSGRDFAFENCLHTYFNVGDINSVKVTGLKGLEYLDQPKNFSRHRDAEDAIQVREEVDRSYLSTTHAVQIHDDALGRMIRIEKEGSASTVVWNPWVAKSKAMADFGDEEFRRMICVESGNVFSDKINLRSGETSRLVIRLSSERAGK